MDENWSPFDLTDFEYDILKVYLKHRRYDMYMYEVPFFENHYTPQTILMTISQFTIAVNKRRIGHDMG